MFNKHVYVSEHVTTPLSACQVCNVLLMVYYYCLWVSGLLLIFSYSVKNNSKFYRINLVPASDENMRGGDACLVVSGEKPSSYSLLEINLFSVIYDL